MDSHTPVSYTHLFHQRPRHGHHADQRRPGGRGHQDGQFRAGPLLELSLIHIFTYREAATFWDRAKAGGRKSFRVEELDPTYFFRGQGGFFIPYLEMLQKDLDSRADE